MNWCETGDVCTFCRGKQLCLYSDVYVYIVSIKFSNKTLNFSDVLFFYLVQSVNPNTCELLLRSRHGCECFLQV